MTRATANAIAAKHHQALVGALTAASVPATAAVLVDVYTDSVDDTSTPRVAALIDEAPNYADNLVSWLAQPDQANQDPADVADRVASDGSVSADTASSLDGIEASGGTTYNIVLDSDKACQACQDAADGGPYDLADKEGPRTPIHGNSACSVEPDASERSVTAEQIARVERHVVALDIAQAIRELEKQEANTIRWAEERRVAEKNRLAEIQRRCQQDLATLQAERLEDEQRKRTQGR